MVASPVRFPEGDGRGECGLEGEGVTGIDALQEGAGQVGKVAGGFGRERGTLERKEPTGGSSLAGWQVGSTRQWKKEERRVMVRGSASWAVGSIQTGPDWLPWSEILFFFFFFLLFFSEILF
jgi:hypothetical protein